MQVNINQLRIFAMTHRLMEIQQEERMKRIVIIDEIQRPPMAELIITAIPRDNDYYILNNPIRENHKRPYKFHR